MNFIKNIREDGTMEFINEQHDELIKAEIDRVQGIQEVSLSEDYIRKVKQIQTNDQARKLLTDTDWISSKYVDTVIVSKTMTEEEFSEKYKDVLVKRQEARDSIIKMPWEENNG